MSNRLQPCTATLASRNTPPFPLLLPALCILRAPDSAHKQECPKVGMLSRGLLWEAASTEHSLQ